MHVPCDELEIMRLLLKAGADPNAAEMDGWRPLWYVKSREASEILISAGASLSERDNLGGRACDQHDDSDIRGLVTPPPE